MLHFFIMENKEIKEYKKLGFDSEEEWLFSFYLDELFDAGYIKSWEHHPEAYVLAGPQKYTYLKALKTKTKEVRISLLREHIYSPDFTIEWNKTALGIFFDTFKSQIDLREIPFIANLKVNFDIAQTELFSIVEIKPSFSMFNMQRELAINIKWMYSKHGIYVQKVIPIDKKKTGLFQTTFCPQRFMYTEKTKKLKKLNFKAKTLQEYVNWKKANI